MTTKDIREAILAELAGLFSVIREQSTPVGPDAAADFNPRGIHGYIPDGRFHHAIDRGWVEYYRQGPSDMEPTTTKWAGVECDPHRIP